MATLYYVHDPMCSWCWGFRPAWQAIRAGLPCGIGIKNVLGGLAPDNDEAMPDDLQAAIQGHWRKIQAMLGTRFNFDFWSACHPRRDTYKACRAVLVAASRGLEEEMIEAIQRAYYLRAMNPSDPEVLLQLGAELGMNEGEFRAELASAETEARLQGELALRRSLGVNSFPSLVLEVEQGRLNIPVSYQDPGASLDLIRNSFEKLAEDKKPNHQEGDG